MKVLGVKIRISLIIVFIFLILDAAYCFACLPGRKFRSSRRVNLADVSSIFKQSTNTKKSKQLFGTHRTATTTKLNNAKENRQDIRARLEKKKKPIVAFTAITLLSSCIAGAVSGVLPGYVGPDSILNIATLLQDTGLAILTAVLGYLFVFLVTQLVKNEKLNPKDSRKIIHTFSAPLFMLFWPLFSNADGARFFAAIVPTVKAVRLFLASNNDDEKDLAVAVSRSGNAIEALQGPFIYVCILAVIVLLFWRTSTIGVIAMSTLAAGDGMADLIGRRFGSTNKWQYNTSKSIVGSLAFWLASSITASGLLWWFNIMGCLTLPMDFIQVAITVTGISLITAIVETIPSLGDDNYSVPISSALLSLIFLQ